MRPRPVVVTLELESDVPLRILRDARAWRKHLCWAEAMAQPGAQFVDDGLKVEQVQANVIRPKPQQKRKAAKR